MKQIFNPYLPSYEYIPDGEPHIFDDRLYIFGSHDRFNGTDYCQNNYVCWSASVNDLSNWTFHGEIYNKNQHPYKEEKMNLFAPDVVRGTDGRFYLYYSMAHSSRMSVAVCDTPAGHYEYLGDVKTADGRVYGISAGDYLQFDPGVFMDEDKNVYLYSGFCPKKEVDEYGHLMQGAFVCKLFDDMLTMQELPHIIIPRDFDGPENAGFFEASSMRKINGLYYFIYSARVNGLHYAISKYPDKDFIYGGRIHSSSDIGLRGYTPENAAYPNGNTHGSIVNINGKYYIFDHRFSNNTSYCRQGVAEPIIIEKNGHISQVEATSCGLNNAPLKAFGTYPAYIACFLKNYSLTPDMPKDKKLSLMPFITQDGEDRDFGNDQYLTAMRDKCMVGFKYFDFNTYTSEHNLNNRINPNNTANNNNSIYNNNSNSNYVSNITSIITITVKGHCNGTISVTTDIDYADKKLEDYKLCGSCNITLDSNEWQTINIPISQISGIKPIYFIFNGTGEFALKEFTF